MAELSVDPAAVGEPQWQLDQEWSRDLAPAFVSGGLFILVVGAGIVWIIRFQYPKARAGETAAPERQEVRSGLRTSGIVAVVIAASTAVAVWLTLGHLGLWPLAIPASILIVGVAFLAVSGRVV